jgi:hypothetical protein
MTPMAHETPMVPNTPVAYPSSPVFFFPSDQVDPGPSRLKSVTRGRPPKQIGKRKLMQLDESDDQEDDGDEEYLPPDFEFIPPPAKKPRITKNTKTPTQKTMTLPSISTETKADQLQQVAAQLQQTVKRGRGRPKGSKNKKGRKGDVPSTLQLPQLPQLPQLSKPREGQGQQQEQQTFDSSTTPSVFDDQKVFRVVFRYPSYLSDPIKVGQLSIYTCNPGFVQRTIQSAEAKLNQVLDGTQVFGKPIVISSFQRPTNLDYVLAATAPNLFFMTVLFSANVMDTRHGKVSVFPVTVFTTESAKQSGKTGYPCLAVHAGHFKKLMWRVYSGTKKLIGNSVLMDQLTPYSCPYNVAEDAPLITFSGFEPYNQTSQKKEGGFILLPAHWLDVIKHFFVTPEFTIRDIGDIFRQVYANIEDLRGKFDNMFRVIWAGEERSANVMDTLKLPSNKHVFSMARARAVSGETRIGGTGMYWFLDPLSSKDALAHYDKVSSFAYGVQCWREQLQYLNSAYAFFTGETPIATSHHYGLLQLDDTLPVRNRDQCLLKGIPNDTGEGTISSHVRSARYRMVSTLGREFLATFFGPEVNIYYKRPKASKSAKSASEPANITDTSLSSSSSSSTPPSGIPPFSDPLQVLSSVCTEEMNPIEAINNDNHDLFLN